MVDQTGWFTGPDALQQSLDAFSQAIGQSVALAEPVLIASSAAPDYFALAARVELCDFRRSTCNCMSKPARCLQGGWPAIVTLSDCLPCVQSTNA